MGGLLLCCMMIAVMLKRRLSDGFDSEKTECRKCWDTVTFGGIVIGGNDEDD